MRAVLFAALFSLPLAAGCGASAQGGLSNAPAANRPASPEDRGHDAIANGPESCDPNGQDEKDPLKHRLPKCPEVEGKKPQAKQPQAPETPPPAPR